MIRLRHDGKIENLSNMKNNDCVGKQRKKLVG